MRAVLLAVACLAGCDYLFLTENPAIDAATFEPSQCPPSYDIAHESSRYLITTRASFALQRMVCRGLFTHLAVVDTLAEATALRGVLPDTDTTYWLGLVQAPGQQSPGSGWRWVTGEPLRADALWGTMQPNDLPLGGTVIEDGEQDRAALHPLDINGYLEDSAAEDELPAICECDGLADP